MTTRINLRISAPVYEELVYRAGGERKISQYVENALLATFGQPDSDLAARVAALEREVRELRAALRG